MKKILALALLIMPNACIYTMESINYDIRQTIQNSLEYSTIEKMAHSADGTKIIVLDSQGDISLWDGISGEVINKRLAFNKIGVVSIGFNKEGTKVILTTGKGTEELDIFNPHALKVIKKDMESSVITKMTQTADGTKIVAIDDCGNISLWDGISGQTIDKFFALNKIGVVSIGFNKEGTKVILTTGKGLEELDIVNPDALRAIKKNLGRTIIRNKAQSADGTKIAILDNRETVSLWDGLSGQPIDKLFATNKKDVLSMSFNANDTALIITSSSGKEEYPIK